MYFKKELNDTVQMHQQEVIKLEKEKRLSLKTRSQEDWDAIDLHLRHLLLERASKPLTWIPFRGKFIGVDCSLLIARKNDSTALFITNEDMKRFCKEHSLTLRYSLDERHDFAYSRKYVEAATQRYLIKVKS